MHECVSLGKRVERDGGKIRERRKESTGVEREKSGRVRGEV